MRDAIHNERFCKGYLLSYEKFENFEVKEKIKRSKKDKVYQYNLKGDFIREFENCDQAASILNIDKKGLQTKMSSNNTYKGFQWSYYKVENLNNIEQKSSSSFPKKIDQFTLDGKFVKTWETYSECRDNFPNVGKVLRGITKKCKGFTFKYNDQVKEIV